MPGSRSRLFVTLLLLIAVAACGDDGGSGGSEEGLSAREQAYADAWARSLTDEEAGFSVSDEDADCMGTAIMAELGVEPFVGAEVQPADIGDGEGGDDDSPGELLGAGTVSDEQADAILDAWEGCTDIAASLAQAAVGEFDLDDDGQACVADGLREDDLARKGLKPSFTSDNDEPPAEVISTLVELIDECSGGEGEGNGVIIDGIAKELAADGTLTQEQARCVAEQMVDTIGLDRLVELGAGDTSLDEADPEVQQEVAGAILAAADACGVPLSQLGG